MQQEGARHEDMESPLSVEHTVKRLDFENISVYDTSKRTMSTMRAQAQQIRRDFERCKEEVTDPTELMESLKVSAADYANVDTSKLWEKYLVLKKEFLQVETENLFLESYSTSAAEPIQDSESELLLLEKQLSDLQSLTAKETEEINFLIGAFTDEMENFPKLLECALNHFDECDEKMHLDSRDFVDHMDCSSLNDESDVRRKVLELSILTGSVQNEILELEARISKEEEYYKRIQSLQKTYTKLDLLNKVLSYFSDWNIAGCKNNVVTLILKNAAATKQKKLTPNKDMKPLKEVVYKLHVKVHPKTLAVENIQLEPKNEALIDPVLKEMTLRRMMHSSEVSEEPHNDLEFLLRRVGQRIASTRRSAM